MVSMTEVRSPSATSLFSEGKAKTHTQELQTPLPHVKEVQETSWKSQMNFSLLSLTKDNRTCASKTNVCFRLPESYQVFNTVLQ